MSSKQINSILIIGMGSLAKVYGAHLILAGKEVTFLVRRQLPLLQNEFYICSQKTKIQKSISQFSVVTAIDPHKKYDAVFITTHTQNLTEVFLKLSAAKFQDTPVFIFCPVWPNFFMQHAEAFQHLFYVVPGVVAHQKNGIEIFKLHPNKIKNFTPNSHQFVKDFIQIFNQSGLACFHDAKIFENILLPSILLYIFLALVEINSGKINHLAQKNNVSLDLALQSLKELMPFLKQHYHISNSYGLVYFLQLPLPLLKKIFRLAVKWMPDFYKNMLESHYIKISAQTHIMLNELYSQVRVDYKMMSFKKFLEKFENRGLS